MHRHADEKQRPQARDGWKCILLAVWWPSHMQGCCTPRPHHVTPLLAGGDWGGFICRALGTLHAQHVAAIHVNLAFATPSYTSPWQMLQARRPAPARCPPGRRLPFLHRHALPALGAATEGSAKGHQARGRRDEGRGCPCAGGTAVSPTAFLQGSPCALHDSACCMRYRWPTACPLRDTSQSS